MPHKARCASVCSVTVPTHASQTLDRITQHRRLCTCSGPRTAGALQLMGWYALHCLAAATVASREPRLYARWRPPVCLANWLHQVRPGRHHGWRCTADTVLGFFIAGAKLLDAVTPANSARCAACPRTAASHSCCRTHPQGWTLTQMALLSNSGALSMDSVRTPLALLLVGLWNGSLFM